MPNPSYPVPLAQFSYLPICLLQDFKTAHLLGVSPVDQFWAMLLGSAASVLVSVAAFVLYTSVWEVPGKEFPAPTSRIWLDMAKLVRARVCEVVFGVRVYMEGEGWGVWGCGGRRGGQPCEEMLQGQGVQGCVGVCLGPKSQHSAVSSLVSTSSCLGLQRTAAIHLLLLVMTLLAWMLLLQVNGGNLPQNVAPFCISFGLLAAALPVLEHWLHGLVSAQRHAGSPDTAGAAAAMGGGGGSRRALAAAVAGKLLAMCPSGIGFAVGMYIAPKWTLPRVLGCVVERAWHRWSPGSHQQLMMVLASGLVLGEGTASIFTAIAHSIFVRS